MEQTSHSFSSETISQLLSVGAILSAILAVTALLLPNPLADVFFAGIVMLSVLFTLVGGIGTWTNRTPLVWVAALLLTGLTVLGMISIGFYFIPSALLLLGAAVFSQLAGPRPEIRDSILADPPTKQDLIQKMLAGIGTIVVGFGVVYISDFTRELFGSCARETLACGLNTTNWGAVGLTVFGLFAVIYGGWLLWKQSYIIRVLASEQTL
jgi:hypothetical protein